MMLVGWVSVPRVPLANLVGAPGSPWDLLMAVVILGGLAALWWWTCPRKL